MILQQLCKMQLLHYDMLCMHCIARDCQLLITIVTRRKTFEICLFKNLYHQHPRLQRPCSVKWKSLHFMCSFYMESKVAQISGFPPANVILFMFTMNIVVEFIVYHVHVLLSCFWCIVAINL